MNKKTLKKIIITSLIFSLALTLINNGSVYAAALTYDGCIAQAAKKLNTSKNSVKNLISVNRACEAIKDKSDWQGAIWLNNIASNNYGGNDIERKTELSGENVTTYLHGIILFNGENNKNLNLHTYAIQIGFYYCSNYAAGSETCSNSVEIPAGKNSKYIKYTAEYDNKSIKLDGQNKNTGLTLDRGEKNRGEYLSEGGYNAITFYPNNIIKFLKDKGKITDSTDSFQLYVYRRGLLSYDGGIIEGGKYDLYGAGYDAESFTIKKEEESFSVSSEVRGRQSTSSEYSSWSSLYSNKIQNGDPNNTDTWNIQFKHTLTINGTDHEIKQTSDCPSGYSCTFSESPSLTPSLTSAGKRTGQQSLTVKQDSTGTSKSSEAAKYEVSKTTTQTETGHKDGSTQSGTITFTADCSPREIGIVEIGLNDTSKTIYYDLDNQKNTDYSGLPSDVKSKINEKKPNNHLNADPYPGEVTKNILPGETKTFNYTGFYKQKITYSYKMRQDTETTISVDENGTETRKTENVRDTYPINISVSEPSMGSQITCPDTTVYRPTEFYEYDNYGNGVENHLKGESHWGSDSTEVNVQATTTNTSILGNTGKLYADSNTNDSITLNYKYINNYHFYPDTVSSRLATLNVVWWKNESTLPSFTPTTINNGTREETETIIVENINGEPNTGDNTELTLGTHDKEICQKAETIHSQIVYRNTTELNSKSNGTLSATTCAHLYRPWNYNLSFTSIESTSNGGKLYLNNEKTSVTLKLQNKNNIDSYSDQEGNPSYSPETTISLYQITIPDSEPITDVNQYIQDLKSSINTGSPLRTPSYIAEQVVQLDPATPTSPQSNKEILFDNVAFTQAGIGDHICLYATANHTNSYEDTKSNSITYYGTPKENALYSSLTCFTVAGFPTFQIRGGSILTEGDVKAKVVESNGEYFGSWIDYGLITKGEIKRLSSGKAFIGSEYKYDPDENRNKNHPLTIANNEENIDEPKGHSNIGASATKERLKSLYAPSAKTPLDGSTFTGNSTYGIEVNISKPDNYTTYTSNQFTTQTSDTNAKYRYTYINESDDNTVIKQESALSKGVTHVIYSTGNIVIGSDFTYNSESYNQISDIPQYIIISEKNIYIDQNVKEIHAWLIADGEINTCTGYEKWNYPEDESNALHKQDGGKGYNSATYTKDICNTALKLYGPLIAKNIWLERTSIGGESVSGVSEIVNLTAENSYWVLAQSRGNGKISTSYIRSLAPRY